MGTISVDANLPLGKVLATLEGRMARLRAEEADHAQREAFHAERKAACAAELAKISEHYEGLRRNLATVIQMGALDALPAPDELPPGKKPTISLAVQQVISRLPADQSFSYREVLDEINRLYANHLGGPLKPRQITGSLRWMARTKRIHQLEAGTSHRGSRYVRRKPEAE